MSCDERPDNDTKTPRDCSQGLGVFRSEPRAMGLTTSGVQHSMFEKGQLASSPTLGMGSVWARTVIMPGLAGGELLQEKN